MISFYDDYYDYDNDFTLLSIALASGAAFCLAFNQPGATAYIQLLNQPYTSPPLVPPPILTDTPVWTAPTS